jgi:hypothetical protein
MRLFQSLSRDSWWSHFAGIFHILHDSLVSIPQSGFLVVTPIVLFSWVLHTRVSIPQSGFLVVTQHAIVLVHDKMLRFNPSVGILGGHTQ